MHPNGHAWPIRRRRPSATSHARGSISAAGGIVISRRLYRTKRESLVGYRPVDDPWELCRCRGFTYERQASADCDER